MYDFVTRTRRICHTIVPKSHKILYNLTCVSGVEHVHLLRYAKLRAWMSVVRCPSICPSQLLPDETNHQYHPRQHRHNLCLTVKTDDGNFVIRQPFKDLYSLYVFFKFLFSNQYLQLRFVNCCFTVLMKWNEVLYCIETSIYVKVFRAVVAHHFETNSS